MSRQEPIAPESYSSFWDAVPIEVSDNDTPMAMGAEDVYAEVPAATEGRPPSHLNVESIDA